MSTTPYTTTRTHVTAIDAADMTGHSERTIRRWLTSGKLRGRKTARGDWEIAVADLPAPARRHGDTLAELRRRVEVLEREIRLLRLIKSPIGAVTRSEAILSEQSAGSTYHTPRMPDAPIFARGAAEDAALDGEVPAGSVLLAPFARVHGVALGTAQHQAERGFIPVTALPNPTRPNQDHRWLSPEQQRAAVEEWRRRGQLRRECDRCPH